MVAVKNRFTPEEYLAIERKAAFRSEYFAGRIYAMSGASRQHNRLTFNVSGILYNQLAEKPCEAFANDMRVLVASSGLYTYPDLVVVCGEPHFEDSELDTLLNPTVIVEVLSDSTEAYDRGRKFAQYQQIATLTDYLLIAQTEPRIEHYMRQAPDQWLLTITTGSRSSVTIASLDVTLLLSEVYARVTFPPNSDALDRDATEQGTEPV